MLVLASPLMVSSEIHQTATCAANGGSVDAPTQRSAARQGRADCRLAVPNISFSESPLLAWAALTVCAVVITWAGTALSRHADILAEKLNVGRTWIGLILLATITSLPELMTGLSAVTIVGAPDIAVGDIMGSCTINLLLFALVDLLYREQPLFRVASQGHLLAAGFGIILLAIASFSLLTVQSGQSWAIGHVSVATPVLLALYLLAARTVFLHERRHRADTETTVRHADVSISSSIRGTGIAALFVVVAGTGLAFAGEGVAVAMAWDSSFVGTVFVALATSLPEATVVIAAVRLRAPDLALGNLLGSNLFNLAILGIDDLAYRPGPLFAAVAPIHAVTAVCALLMTGMVIVGLTYRPERRLFRMFGWVSIGLLAVYILNLSIILRSSSLESTHAGRNRDAAPAILTKGAPRQLTPITAIETANES